MRNPCLFVIALALAACGPSSKEVAGARTARYKGDKMTLWGGVKSVTESKYKIDKTDDTAMSLQTIARVYDPNGLVAGERNANQVGQNAYTSTYPDLSLIIAMNVALQPDGDAFLVVVHPIIERYHAGSPQTEPLHEGDISLPGWVQGKVDQLALELHEALAQFEVKTVPAAAPAS